MASDGETVTQEAVRLYGRSSILCLWVSGCVRISGLNTPFGLRRVKHFITQYSV